MKKYNTKKVVLLVVTALLLLAAIFLPDKNWGILVKSVLALTELFLILFSMKDAHNTVKVVLVTMLAFMVLTWILPAANYSGAYLDQGRVQMGLFDLLVYPLNIVFVYFGYIMLFVLLLGGFYGILNKIPAYRSFLDKIVAASKDREEVTLVVMMVLLAVLTSVFGIQLGLLIFFPMLASIILLMGYDKIVAALTLVGSISVGLAGTTYGYGNVSLLLSLVNAKITDDMVVKVVILLVGLVLLVFNTLMYARSSKVASKKNLASEKKVIKTEEVKEESIKVEKVVSEKTKEKTSTKKKSTTNKNAKKPQNSGNKKSTSAKKSTSKAKASRKDNKAASKGDDVIVVKESLVDDSINDLVPTVVDSKHKVWPIVVGFVLLFVITVMALLPWSELFGLDTFEKATANVTEFELFGFPLFGKLLGNVGAFGGWSVAELGFVMTLLALILAFIYKVKVDDVFDGFANGVKKALGPLLIVAVLYTCLVMNTYHPYQLVIYKAVLGITKGFNIVTTTLAAMLSSLFNGEGVYVFQAVLPYLTGQVTNAEVYPVIGILFQSVYGVSMLVAPTSLVLTLVLSYLGVSFSKWLKATWRLLVELLLVLLVIFTILVLV